MSLNISDFSLFSMEKLQPPWKRSPPLPQQPPFLNIEVLSSPPPPLPRLKIWSEVQPPFQNINYIVRKHWNIRNSRRTLQGVFQKEPITDFKRNRNLKELLGSNCIENGKAKRETNTFTIGKCSPCLSKTSNLCCSQLTTTTLSTNEKKI